MLFHSRNISDDRFCAGPDFLIIKNIQILRAIAANFVVVSHLWAVEQQYGQWGIIPERSQILGCGVDLFFVISGFIMATIISRERSWKIFVWRRVIRIYPLYWVYTSLTILCFLSVHSLVLQQGHSLWKSYLLIPDSLRPILGVGWTLVYEMYFYIILAICLACRLPIKWIMLFWVVAILVAPNDNLWIVTNPLCLEFIMGMAIGFLIKANLLYLPQIILISSVTVLLLVFIYFPNIAEQITLIRTLLFGGIFSFMVYGAAAVREARYCDWLVKIGDASYSIYLSHVLILAVISHVAARLPAHGFIAEIGFLFASMGVINVFGLASYNFLEKPSLAYLRKVIKN